MSEPIISPLIKNNLSHGVSALLNKKARLLGEIEELNEKISTIKSDIAVLDRAMTIIEPKTNIDILQPKPKRVKNRYFRVGELRRAILSELRLSNKPLSVREISELIANKKSITTKITDSVKTTMRYLEKERLISLTSRGDTYEKVFIINSSVADMMEY